MKHEHKSEGKHAVVLALSGTVQGGPDAEAFLSTIRELIHEGRRNVLLDLGGVTWINSTGLGRIPNYYLRRAHEENRYFQRAHRLTLRESVHAFSLKLWDAERGRMIGWREIGERRPPTATRD